VLIMTVLLCLLFTINKWPNSSLSLIAYRKATFTRSKLILTETMILHRWHCVSGCRF